MTKTGQGTQARLGAVSSLSCPVRPTTAGADASLASSCCRNRAPLTHPTTRGLASPAPGVTPSWRGGRGRGAGGGEGSRSASRSPGGGGEPVSRGGSRSGAVVEREGEGDGAQTANGGRRERAGRVAYATPRPRPAARGGGGGGGAYAVSGGEDEVAPGKGPVQGPLRQQRRQPQTSAAAAAMPSLVYRPSLSCTRSLPAAGASLKPRSQTAPSAQGRVQPRTVRLSGAARPRPRRQLLQYGRDARPRAHGASHGRPG